MKNLIKQISTKVKLTRIAVKYRSGSTANLFVSILWCLHHPMLRSSPSGLSSDAGGFIAENGAEIRYGTFNYWLYCVVG